MHDSVIEALGKPTQKNLDKLFNRIIQDERLFALAYCDIQNKMIYKTQTMPSDISCEPVDESPAP